MLSDVPRNLLLRTYQPGLSYPSVFPFSAVLCGNDLALWHLFKMQRVIPDIGSSILYDGPKNAFCIPVCSKIK